MAWRSAWSAETPPGHHHDRSAFGEVGKEAVHGAAEPVRQGVGDGGLKLAARGEARSRAADV